MNEIPRRRDGKIPVCPECDSTQIEVTNGRGRAGTTRTSWWCRCGARFDEPAWRKPENYAESRKGLSKQLVEADPDEVTRDGRE